MATRTSAQHVFMFLWIIGSVAARDLKAEPGEDVTLQCNSPTDAAVQKLVWSRLGLDKSVFFFRDNRLIETNQNPRYRGRVELKDPEMKNGNASVVLKNVDIDDSGTYQCEVTTSSSQPVQSINLIVLKDSGEMRVNAGEDVLLQCNGPTDAAITKLKWDRPGMKGHSVFFFKKKTLYEKVQNLVHHRYDGIYGRVELKYPDVKNGDASILLKKVSTDDAGTYQCWVTTSNKPNERKLVRSVHLIVSDDRMKKESEKREKDQSEEIHGLKVGLGISLGLVCLLVGVACFALGRFVFPKLKGGPL